MSVTVLSPSYSTATKQVVPTTIDTSSTLSTSFAQIGNADGYLIANNPNLSMILDWTISAGTTLTVRFKVSHNGTTWQYAPSFGAASSGTSAASIAELTFASSTWDVGGGISRCMVEADLQRWAYVSPYVKSNNASGTVAGTIAVGRES